MTSQRKDLVKALLKTQTALLAFMKQDNTTLTEETLRSLIMLCSQETTPKSKSQFKKLLKQKGSGKVSKKTAPMPPNLSTSPLPEDNVEEKDAQITESQLKKMKISELREFGTKHNIDIPKRIKKNDIIAKILRELTGDGEEVEEKEVEIATEEVVSVETDYKKMKVSELKKLANELGITKYSKLKKSELIQKIRDAKAVDISIEEEQSKEEEQETVEEQKCEPKEEKTHDDTVTELTEEDIEKVMTNNIGEDYVVNLELEDDIKSYI